MNKSLLVLLAMSLAMVGCKKIADRNAQADELARKVLKMMAADEGMKIYEEMGAAELRDQVTAETWADLAAKFKTLGEPKTFKRTSFNIETNNGVTTGNYGYDVTWEKGKGTFTLKTKIENDQWTVLGANFEATYDTPGE